MPKAYFFSTWQLRPAFRGRGMFGKNEIGNKAVVSVQPAVNDDALRFMEEIRPLDSAAARAQPRLASAEK
jgi:hypothetical protein